jgi:hypothetical protein
MTTMMTMMMMIIVISQLFVSHTPLSSSLSVVVYTRPNHTESDQPKNSTESKPTARHLGGNQPQPPGASPAIGRPPTANPFVQLQYDQATYATQVAYGTSDPVFLETFAFSENASMLTRRVRLELWSAPPAGSAAAAAAAAGATSAMGGTFASLSSMDGPGARREYFGGTAVNLDLSTEGAVQDRWYALGGGEGGEVRVRLAVVAGGPEEEDTQEVIDFCCNALGSSSKETLLVEVIWGGFSVRQALSISGY